LRQIAVFNEFETKTDDKKIELKKTFLKAGFNLITHHKYVLNKNLASYKSQY